MGTLTLSTLIYTIAKMKLSPNIFAIFFFLFFMDVSADKLQLLLTHTMCFKRDRYVCRAMDIQNFVMADTSGFLCAPKTCWNKECKEGKNDNGDEITYTTYDCSKEDDFPLAWVVILPLLIGLISTFAIYKSGLCQPRPPRRENQD